jgi:oligoribonuclease NrnB/cAMP/cGMP phosphodiesterase (DHH superfamily)
MCARRVFCITHGEDADGLTCAALLKRLVGAKPILVNYDDFLSALEKVQPPVDKVFICDLNIREALINEIARISGFADVTIIDHHLTEEGLLEALKEIGVDIIHDTRDSASVLLYNHFKEKFGREAGRLAAYAAWSDQFEDGPIATKLLWEYDRQLVQFEAMILTYAITQMQNQDFWMRVVNGLSKLDFPHEIPGVVESSLTHLMEMTKIIKYLPQNVIRLGSLAYIAIDDDEPIGAIANLIIDTVDVNVGLCYKTQTDCRVNISIRSKRGLSFNLGIITKRIAAKHGGFGGGHKRASGASIPKDSLMDFIHSLKTELPSL